MHFLAPILTLAVGITIGWGINQLNAHNTDCYVKWSPITQTFKGTYTSFGVINRCAAK